MALHSLLHSPSGKPPVDWGGTNLNMIVVAVIFSITTWHCIWVYIFAIASHFVSNLSDGTRDGGYSQLQGCFHQTMFIFRTANIICIISNGEKNIDITRIRYVKRKWRNRNPAPYYNVKGVLRYILCKLCQSNWQSGSKTNWTETDIEKHHQSIFRITLVFTRKLLTCLRWAIQTARSVLWGRES